MTEAELQAKAEVFDRACHDLAALVWRFLANPDVAVFAEELGVFVKNLEVQSGVFARPKELQ